MKKWIAMIVAIVMALTLCACVKTDNNIDHYAEDVALYQAGSFMPDLGHIGKYDDVVYFSRKDSSFFPTYSMQLIVKYDEEEYLKEKERLKTAYIYLEEPQMPEFDNTAYTLPIEEFSAKGFDFRVAKFVDTDYPKNFGMVGISDERFEVAYLWIYAPDLDYICESSENELKAMNEFLETYFSLE